MEQLEGLLARTATIEQSLARAAATYRRRDQRTARPDHGAEGGARSHRKRTCGGGRSVGGSVALQVRADLRRAAAAPRSSKRRNGICQGCRMRVPPQLYNELQKHHEIRMCPNCHRIIFWRAEPERADRAEASDGRHSDVPKRSALRSPRTVAARARRLPSARAVVYNRRRPERVRQSLVPVIAAGGKSGLRRAGWPLTAAPSDRGKVPQKRDGLGVARRRGVGETAGYDPTSRAGDGIGRQTPPGARQTRRVRGPRFLRVRRLSRRATVGPEE